MNLLATFVAIASVDRLGRRVLMLAGSAGLAVIYTLIGLSYATGNQGTHVLLLAVAAIACYACSLAPSRGWCSRRFSPTGSVARPCSLAVLALWVACFILTFTFPILIEHLGFGGHLLDLRNHLRAGLRLHLPSASRDQEQDAGRDRGPAHHTARGIEGEHRP